jgi:hypothetical protein
MMETFSSAAIKLDGLTMHRAGRNLGLARHIAGTNKRTKWIAIGSGQWRPTVEVAAFLRQHDDDSSSSDDDDSVSYVEDMGSSSDEDDDDDSDHDDSGQALGDDDGGSVDESDDATAAQIAAAVEFASSGLEGLEGPREKVPIVFENRVGKECVHEEQTYAYLWCTGQTEALVWFMNSLPKGSLERIERKSVGCCERLKLHLKNNKIVTIESAESVGRQMHPNRRYVVATLTAPGFSPVSAERSLKALGVGSVTAATAVHVQRRAIMKKIRTLADECIKEIRKMIAVREISRGNTVRIDGDDVAWVLAHSTASDAAGREMKTPSFPDYQPDAHRPTDAEPKEDAEPSHKKPKTQPNRKCTRCRQAGHKAANCQNSPNCSKCDGIHITRNCPYPKHGVTGVPQLAQVTAAVRMMMK